MYRVVLAVVSLLLIASACGGNTAPDEVLSTSFDAAQTCLVGDPDCKEIGDQAPPDELPAAVGILSDDAEGIQFGGFFYSDGSVSQLCSALLESTPPQCASTIIEIDASIDIVLEHVAESFGSAEDAKINIDQGIYWTDEWVNLAGSLTNNRLVLAG